MCAHSHTGDETLRSQLETAQSQADQWRSAAQQAEAHRQAKEEELSAAVREVRLCKHRYAHTHTHTHRGESPVCMLCKAD